MLICPHHAADSFPGNKSPGHSQYPCRIPERSVILQPVSLRYLAVGERYQRILNDPQSHLMLNFLGFETRIGLILHYEALYLAIGDVPGPNDGKISPGGI